MLIFYFPETCIEICAMDVQDYATQWNQRKELNSSNISGKLILKVRKQI